MTILGIIIAITLGVVAISYIDQYITGKRNINKS
jgi:hypothetical protein